MRYCFTLFFALNVITDATSAQVTESDLAAQVEKGKTDPKAGERELGQLLECVVVTVAIPS